MPAVYEAMEVFMHLSESQEDGLFYPTSANPRLPIRVVTPREFIAPPENDADDTLILPDPMDADDDSVSAGSGDVWEIDEEGEL